MQINTKRNLSAGLVLLILAAGISPSTDGAYAAGCPSGYSVKRDILLHSIEVTTDTDTTRKFLNGTWSATWCSNGKKSIRPALKFRGQAAIPNVTLFLYLSDASYFPLKNGVLEATGIYSMRSCFRYQVGKPCDQLDDGEMGTLVIGLHPRGYFVDEAGLKLGSRLDQWNQ